MEAVTGNVGVPPSTTAQNAWWLEQDRVLSTEGPPATLLRPAVTTGAPLPWGTKRSALLGPPRAFQSHSSSLPKITLATSSPARAEANALPMPHHLQIPIVIANPPPSPGSQQESAAVQLSTGQDPSFQEACTQDDSLVSAGGETDFVQQVSMPSCESENSQDQQAPKGFVPGSQTITTAHNIQGAYIGARNPNNFGGIPESPFASMGNGLGSSSGGANTFTVTSSAGYPQHGTAVTTGHKPESGTLAGGSRREGLRGNLKRKEDTSTLVEPQSSGEPDPASSDSLHLDLRLGDIDSLETRRVRRRQNNRESAQRVRERQETDLQEAHNKITALRAEQGQWIERCNSYEAACKQVHQQLEVVQGRLASAVVENCRLQAELEYLRRNTQMDGCQDGKLAGHQPSTTEMHLRGAVVMPTGAEIAADLASGDRFVSQQMFREPAVQDWKL